MIRRYVWALVFVYTLAVVVTLRYLFKPQHPYWARRRFHWPDPYRGAR